MTVESSVNRAQYETNGTTGPWTVPFYFLDDSHLSVIYTDAAGNETTLTLTTHYSVAGAGDPSGGSVSTVTAYTVGGYITILRDVPSTQLVDYTETDSFPAETHERALDQLTMLLQQLQEVVGRALVFSPSDTAGSSLPAAAARAGLLLGFNAQGQVLLSAPASGSAADLALNLADTTAATKGAGLLGFGDNQTYASGTAGLVLQGFVNAKAAPYNCKGDGVADDTAGLDAAEDAAFASGRALLIPGGTYLYNGQFAVRCNVTAYGATIKQTAGAVVTSNAAGLVTVGADDVTIVGLNLDCNLKSTGFAGTSRARVQLRSCKASNCINLGFGFYDSDQILISECRASNIRYSATGATGLAADGFYFGGCTRSKWVNCYADNFRRIGFVSEGSLAKGNQIQALFCVATNANNCDDSLSEYNAGFWAENTNSIDWLYCIASGIASGTGQTSGRVAGLWALGGGNDSRGLVNIIGCRVFGGTNYLPRAMPVSGTNTYADVLIENCYLNRCLIGVSVGCGLNSLTVRNLVIEDISTSSGSQGGILIDNGGTALLPILEIDKVTVTGAVWHADAGLINFYSAPAACKYTLRNVKGAVPHVMRGPVSRLRAEECEIACGSTSYASFLATYQEHIDPNYASRNGANTDYIVNGGALASGSEVVFRGGTVTGYGAGWAPEFSGTSITTRCYGTTFNNYCWNYSTGGTFLNHFDHCKFLSAPATVGSIRANFNVPTKQILQVQNCYFESANVADTPIRKWSNNPTKSVLHNNTYTATALHDFSATTSVVNNVAV